VVFSSQFDTPKSIMYQNVNQQVEGATVFNFIRGLFGGGNTNQAEMEAKKRKRRRRVLEKKRDPEAEIFERVNLDEEVLGTGVDKKTVRRDLDKRKKHLSKLKGQIRMHWTKYQENLESIREESGIDELEGKTKAAEAKKAAKDKEQLFKLLYKEYSALKNALRKNETIRVVSGKPYRVSVAELDTVGLERQMEEFQEELMSAETNVKEFNRELNRADHEVELDFSDLEKDVGELEMDTSDMDEDLQIVVEEPEEPLVEEDWN